jgi:hypothetical protein
VGAVFDAVVLAAPATRTLVPQLLAGGNEPEFGWPTIARMLAEVSRGESTTLDALTAAVSLGAATEDPWISAGKLGYIHGVLCADYGPQRDYAALSAASQTIHRLAPRFAWKFWDANVVAHATHGVGDCVGWPLEVKYPPHRLQVGSHPNVMVANATHDPPTPLINALSVWLQIPDARLLLADTDGHQSLGLSLCAYEAMLSFLLDPTSVETTTLCLD